MQLLIVRHAQSHDGTIAAFLRYLGEDVTCQDFWVKRARIL
jgi:hypothetical protein